MQARAAIFGVDRMAGGSFQTQALVVADHFHDAPDEMELPTLQVSCLSGWASALHATTPPRHHATTP